MNYKIRYSKNQPAMRPVWPDHFFHYFWWQKNGKTRSAHARLHTTVAMEEGSVWVSQSIVNCGQSMKVATFSTRDLRTRSQILCSYSRIAIGWTKNWWSCECFLVNYVNEGDSRKFSSMDDSRYTVYLRLGFLLAPLNFSDLSKLFPVH